MAIPSSMSWALKKIMSSRDILRDENTMQQYSKHGKFSIRKLYLATRELRPNVSWKRIVCNNKAAPKSVFITQLVLLGRVNTEDKLAHWNLITDTRCSFCAADEETITHLFFQCPYAHNIWSSCLQLLHINRAVMSFFDEVTLAAKHCRHKQAKHQVYGMLFAEAIYNIWL